MLMDKNKKLYKDDEGDTDIGFILWKLESIDKFYPCFKTMLKK